MEAANLSLATEWNMRLFNDLAEQNTFKLDDNVSFAFS